MMSKDEQAGTDAIAALRARFEQQSARAQAYYTVMNAVRGVAGGDDAANAWMNEALPAFDGKTPSQLVGEGRTEDVLAHVRSLKQP
jgi:uncharacterized protein (DUF2384 family)